MIKPNKKTRMVTATAAAAAACYGLRRGGTAGGVVGILGSAVLAKVLRGASEASFRASDVVSSPPMEVFSRICDFEESLGYAAGARSLTRLRNSRCRWVERRKGGDVIWEGEVTESIPGEKLAWRARSELGVETGEIYLEPLNEGTRLLVVLKTNRARGLLASLLARLNRTHPEIRLKRLLRGLSGQLPQERLLGEAVRSVADAPCESPS